MRYYRFILVVVAILFTGSPFAQEKLWYEKNFLAYNEYLSKEFGIVCDIPDRFTDLDKYYVIWKVREEKDRHSGGLYGPVFLSGDKGCLLIYAARPFYITGDDAELFKRTAMIERLVNNDPPASVTAVSPGRNYPRSQISVEINTALGLYYRYGHPSNNDSVKIDLNDYMRIISGNKAHAMFNADSIFIYDIPGADSVYFFDSSLEEMRMGKYPYCTGIFICKDGRATMYFKLFFTERSSRKKEKYFNMLSKQVWYVDNFRQE